MTKSKTARSPWQGIIDKFVKKNGWPICGDCWEGAEIRQATEDGECAQCEEMKKELSELLNSVLDCYKNPKQLKETPK